MAGSYTRRMGPDEHRHLEGNPEAVEELFAELMTETLRRRLRHAEERLAGSDVRILTAPGNDDPGWSTASWPSTAAGGSCWPRARSSRSPPATSC